MDLRSELLKSIWYGFTALDLERSGKVSKSQLKVNEIPEIYGTLCKSVYLFTFFCCIISYMLHILSRGLTFGKMKFKFEIFIESAFQTECNNYLCQLLYQLYARK